MNSEIQYILSLQAVRDKSRIVLDAALKGDLTHFDYHGERMDEVADFVSSVIERDFGPDRFNEIPPHGRWQHFEVGNVPRVATLISDWKAASVDTLEITRRLIDLFFVSVLLDAGAGDSWTFLEPGTKDSYSRSEGIALASLYMFKNGEFASFQSGSKAMVDGRRLQGLTEAQLNAGFQISPTNPMIGVGSRAQLLANLGKSLLAQHEIFGRTGRPGNLVDYLLKTQSMSGPLDYITLWNALQQVLIPTWPKDRTHIGHEPIGDAWPLQVLQRQTSTTASDHARTAGIQPFHKLTQWLAYSLMVPFVRLLGLKWKNAELGTGLPEYRNGGLFVDMQVLTLKDAALARGKAETQGGLPSFQATDDLIVEWRAMTVALLDELYKSISTRFREKKGVELSMAQMLEAGSWKSGRELAAKNRPDTKSSPIGIMGDGTLF